MDLNYLYHRQQVSLMRADLASCGPSRAAHEELAQLYFGVIERRKRERGVGRPSGVPAHVESRRDIIEAARAES